jgi:hypothetical protein
MAASLLVAWSACSREDASLPEPSRAKLSAAPSAASVAPAKATEATAVQPTPATVQSLDEFQQALERKFDRRQIIKEAASPKGGVLYAPNGHVAHAMVLVKNPDGTIGQRCISSSAEARALVNQARAGAGQ